MTDAEFEAVLFSVFGSDAGQKVLGGLARRYGEVVPPSASDAELRHREGQRSVLADILEGMARERQRRAAAATGTAGGGRRKRAG